MNVEWGIARAAFASSAEYSLEEMIEVVPPVRGIMPLAVYIPDVRNVLLLQIGVHSLADADEPVFVAAGEKQQL